MTDVAVILAGGDGGRFWPLSRKSKPKQLLKIYSNYTMVRETFLRLNHFMATDKIFIVTSQPYIEKIAQDVPEIPPENYIIEPLSKDTAAAIALATIYIQRRYPASTMVICPSDHIINEIFLFEETLKNGFNIAKETACLLTIGISPDRIETAYGYIQTGDIISKQRRTEAFEVKEFVEKPDYNHAAGYIEKGNYLWDSGIFIWDTQTVLEELSKFMPLLYSGMLEISDHLGTENEDQIKAKVFQSLEKTSISYGLLEKSKNILCIKAEFKWDDIGSWSSLYRCLQSDDDNNIQSGNVMTHDTKESIIIGDNNSLIGVIGLKDVIIIKARNAILICNKHEDQKVKELLQQIIEKETLEDYL